jgi:hypothetical protein
MAPNLAHAQAEDVPRKDLVVEARSARHHVVTHGEAA